LGPAELARNGAVILTLVLAYEAFHNPGSYWTPYLRLLPREFPGM
jgi:hypothetical protein